jgi:hypothetical protein
MGDRRYFDTFDRLSAMSWRRHGFTKPRSRATQEFILKTVWGLQ